jgi:hypothetical protein
MPVTVIIRNVVDEEESRDEVVAEEKHKVVKNEWKQSLKLDFTEILNINSNVLYMYGIVFFTK